MPLATDPTGSFVECEGGWKHREVIATCPSKLPRAGVIPPSSEPTIDLCHSDADCVAQPNGHCEAPEAGAVNNACFYGCTSDADCARGFICECGTSIGTCIASTCASDADCGEGLNCASYAYEPGCNFPAYACQQTADQCASDDDCSVGLICTVSGADAIRVCSMETCAVGRPFLVEAEQRRAAVVGRADWAARCAPELSALSIEQRRLLAKHWSKVGCLEHASIAAFARFALELLAFGAPRELLELCNAAQADETLHAELAFALASSYHGAPLGPGPLDVAGALDAPNLTRSVRTAFLEGCIGETVAAIEAAAARDATADPNARAVLERIAADEARHAELAFRFVKWALSRCAPELGAELLTLAHIELERATGTPGKGESSELRAHGMLSDAERRALRRDALQHAVLPCLHVLVHSEPSNHGSSFAYRESHHA
ncbi:MAG: ferritin-like domain-containing protein [Polyangiaceae bacterium]